MNNQFNTQATGFMPMNQAQVNYQTGYPMQCSHQNSAPVQQAGFRFQPQSHPQGNMNFYRQQYTCMPNAYQNTHIQQPDQVSFQRSFSNNENLSAPCQFASPQGLSNPQSDIPVKNLNYSSKGKNQFSTRGSVIVSEGKLVKPQQLVRKSSPENNSDHKAQAFMVEQDVQSQKTAVTSSHEQTSSGSFPDFDDSPRDVPTMANLNSGSSEKSQKKKRKNKKNNEAKKNEAGKGNQEDWKNKVKTELCKFWLQGVECENSGKDQGCGFAHGVKELQKKRGLNKQYLTTVCKNFVDDPRKCAYGHRCIFQHPSTDIFQRQPYTVMMKDNVKYTAMRLFQEIENADTIYINTYALHSPRLPIFKAVCSQKEVTGSQKSKNKCPEDC